MTQDTPPKRALWLQILDILSQEIVEGQYPKGQKLPSEAALATRFLANRHTVRRALAALQDDGTIYVRRGSGAFVTRDPVDYRLGRKTRFSQNLAGTGLRATREILRFETLPATPLMARLLQRNPGEDVHVVESLSHIENAPFSYSKSIFPAEMLPDLHASLKRHPSITRALRDGGIPDFTRAWTYLTAKRAKAIVARSLHITEGAPVLRSVGLNVDMSGTPVEYGRTWFHGDRAQLLVGGEDEGPRDKLS